MTDPRGTLVRYTPHLPARGDWRLYRAVDSSRQAPATHGSYSWATLEDGMTLAQWRAVKPRRLPIARPKTHPFHTGNASRHFRHWWKNGWVTVWKDSE